MQGSNHEGSFDATFTLLQQPTTFLSKLSRILGSGESGSQTLPPKFSSRGPPIASRKVCSPKCSPQSSKVWGKHPSRRDPCIQGPHTTGHACFPRFSKPNPHPSILSKTTALNHKCKIWEFEGKVCPRLPCNCLAC